MVKPPTARATAFTALALFVPMIFAVAGCGEKATSLARERLSEWLPKSASEVYSQSSGGGFHGDDTTLITFKCAHSDLLALRQKFAAETRAAVWAKSPLDRRTDLILAGCSSSFHPPTSIMPKFDSPDLEYLKLPEPDPFVAEGMAVVIDSKKDRLWFMISTF